MGTSNTKISLWMYQNSTTCMVVPPASTTKSKESLKQRPSHEPWIHTLSMNTVLTPTIDEENKVEETTTTTADTEKKTTAESSSINHDYAIVNGIIATPGGAHDVLAETIRLWRCLLTNLDPHFQHGDDIDDDDDYDSDDDDGKGKQHRNTTAARNEIHVFAPYVPLLKKNNTDNNDVAAAKKKNKNDNNDDNDDSSYFLSAEYNELLVRESKVKVFDVGTASSLMTAIGLATILDPIVNRPLPTFLDNDTTTDGNNRTVDTTPFSLFWNGSVSGGIWNCPYTLNSVTGYAGYVLGKLYNYYDTYAAPYLVSTSDENNNTNPPNNNDGTTTNTTTETTTTTNDVPSTLGEPMPDIVRERLEILA